MALEIERLSKRFNGIPAVDDVSFVIQGGEILGYVGPNGAGKSLNAGARLEPAMLLTLHLSPNVAMFCRDGLRRAAAGLAIGFVLGFGLERLLRAAMLGVTDDVPLVLFCMPLVLAGAVGLAIYIPARKATRVDPVDALRC